MEHKKAAAVLIRLLDTYPLEAEEQEAVLTAIGVLSWTLFAESGRKARKAKRDKAADLSS